jgi:hypothetical protein
MIAMPPVVSADDHGRPSSLGHSRCLQKYLSLLETYFRGAGPGIDDDGMWCILMDFSASSSTLF